MTCASCLSCLRYLDLAESHCQGLNEGFESIIPWFSFVASMQAPAYSPEITSLLTLMAPMRYLSACQLVNVPCIHGRPYYKLDDDVD